MPEGITQSTSVGEQATSHSGSVRRPKNDNAFVWVIESKRLLSLNFEDFRLLCFLEPLDEWCNRHDHARLLRSPT